MFKLFKSKEEKRAEVDANIIRIQSAINNMKGGKNMVKLDSIESDYDDEDDEEEEEIQDEEEEEVPRKIVKKPIQLPLLPQPKKVLPKYKPAVAEKVEVTEIVKETEVGFKIPGTEEGQAVTKDGLLLWIANKLLEIESRLQ